MVNSINHLHNAKLHNSIPGELFSEGGGGGVGGVGGSGGQTKQKTESDF